MIHVFVAFMHGLSSIVGMTVCVPEGGSNVKVISVHCLIAVV